MEQKDYTILRVRKETHRLLKRIAVFSEESMVQTLDRLARQEWARIQKGEQGGAPVQEDQA
jgi:DNA-binding PadR family transcriptional regulator